MGGLNMNSILEDVTKSNLEKLVGKIMTLAIQNGYYEFVPGFYLCDNEYLIEYQKTSPDNPFSRKQGLYRSAILDNATVY
jgi:hypothetical protein